MSSNGRASLCLGSKQDAKGIIPNDAPNTACTGQVGFVAIFKHFPGSGFLCSQAESTLAHRRVTPAVGRTLSNQVETSKMKDIERDAERERRIHDEAIVDAYGPEEQALGWCYYLDDKITFPFLARCTEARRISPLKKGEKVSVIDMAPEDDCMHEMFVVIEWKERNFGVPLAQLEPIDVDELTQEAIADWHYWVKRGYQLV
jgi:hypothetical protein